MHYALAIAWTPSITFNVLYMKGRDLNSQSLRGRRTRLRGSSWRRALPLTRRLPANGLEAWLEIVVSVRDRHSTLNITCVAQARNAMGTAGTGWSESQSTVGEGEQTLFFGAPGVGLPDVGPYVVVCSLPPMEEVNQPSYIASYSITEP